MTIPAALLAQYRLLCASTSCDTVDRNAMTARYATRFLTLACSINLREARAWLLGTLITDFHPEPDTNLGHPHAEPPEACNRHPITPEGDIPTPDRQ